MESEKTSAFISYLDQRTTSVQEDTLRLIADYRRDEANFEKIRANIFQIVKTMLQASARISQEESERIGFLEAKLALFQETWEKYWNWYLYSSFGNLVIQKTEKSRGEEGDFTIQNCYFSQVIDNENGGQDYSDSKWKGE